MQERRTTIRVNHLCRTQYCPADDLVPRDGQITNLSERGAGALVRETHRDGERVTVNFFLPGEDDPLTATGVVRWSDLRSPRSRWCRLGLEWLPLEETARNRLRRFLYSHPQLSSSRAVTAGKGPFRGGSLFRKIVLLAGIMGGPLLVVLLGLKLLSLQRENRALEAMTHQRAWLITQLGQRQASLQDELGAAKVHVAAAVGEVIRMDRQAQLLEGEVTQLHHDVGRVQESFRQAREEREQLMQRVLDLEQERAQFIRRLRATQELRRAILETIKARREARRYLATAALETSHQSAALGNRGYLMHDGRSTIGRPIMWIRVHDPSTQSAPSASSSPEPPPTGSPSLETATPADQSSP